MQPYDGSEPLILTWDETRAVAEKYGVMLTITTNVQFLDEAKFMELKDITQTLCLSIDSHIPEVFEKIRLRANTSKVFQNLETTARLVREHNLECVVNVVFMTENAPFLPDTLAYFADLGLDFVNVMQMIDINHQSQFHDPLAHFSDEFVFWVKQRCLDVCRKKKMRLLWNVGPLEIVDHRDQPIPPHPRKRENDHWDWRMRHYLPGFCRNVLNKVRVEFDGNVAPCCYATQGQLSLGNLKEQDFDEIWNSTAARDLRRAMYTGDVPSLCVNCRIREPIGAEDDLMFTGHVISETHAPFFEHLDLNEGEQEERSLTVVDPPHLQRCQSPPIFTVTTPYSNSQFLLALSLGGESEELHTQLIEAKVVDGQTSFGLPEAIWNRLQTNLGYWIAIWQAGDEGEPPVRCEQLNCIIRHEDIARLPDSNLGYDDEGHSPLYELGGDKSVGFSR